MDARGAKTISSSASGSSNGNGNCLGGAIRSVILIRDFQKVSTGFQVDSYFPEMAGILQISFGTIIQSIDELGIGGRHPMDGDRVAVRFDLRRPEYFRRNDLTGRLHVG
jgi:hypothetical protein